MAQENQHAGEVIGVRKYLLDVIMRVTNPGMTHEELDKALIRTKIGKQNLDVSPELIEAVLFLFRRSAEVNVVLVRAKVKRLAWPTGRA